MPPRSAGIPAMTGIANLAHFFATHPLSQGSPSKAWLRFAAWQLQSRMRDEVIHPWIEGQKLAIRRGMTGATGNVYVGLHEFADMMLVLHFLTEGDLFLDVGANIGSYTVLASGVRRAVTMAFEPDPGTARSLRRNAALNGFEDRLTLHEIALGDADGEVRFTRGLDTINRVATPDDGDSRIVQMRRLDSVVGDAQPAMMKLDVEGFEQQVVRGAEATLAKPSLKLVELETVGNGIEAVMTRHGFQRGYYDPWSRKLTTTPGPVPASNAVFVRDWSFVEARLAAARPVDVHGRAI